MSCIKMHAVTPLCTDSNIHAATHADKFIQTYMFLDVYTYTHNHSHTYTHGHTHTHVNAHTNTHIHTLTHIHINAHIRTLHVTGLEESEGDPGGRMP